MLLFLNDKNGKNEASNGLFFIKKERKERKNGQINFEGQIRT